MFQAEDFARTHSEAASGVVWADLFKARVHALCADRPVDVNSAPMTLQTAMPGNSALVPADALRAGTLLEDYEIDCVIARSAVAMVYRATDRRSNQRVAIKEFLPTGLAMRGDDGQVVAREIVHEQIFLRGRKIFLDEAKALAKCDHACLMRVLCVLEGYGTVYKVMPYCPGPTLLEHRQKMSAAPTDPILRAWLEGLLGALARFHDRGQVHGAVSPGNILVTADDRLLLLDSEAVHAAILSERTRSMIAMLEPCFSPQEQCEPTPARPLGPWTDLYALAATLRFCISGKLPGTFAQGPRGARLESERHSRGIAGESAGGQRGTWESVLDTCLTESAKNRPQSVAELMRLLDLGRAPSPAGMSTATAGLAPLLSSPIVRPPPAAARPLQPAPDSTGSDTEPEMETSLNAVRQATREVEQLPLPLVLPRPAVTAKVHEANVDRVAEPSATAMPLDAALTADPARPDSADMLNTSNSRSRFIWVLVLLALVAMVLGGATLFTGRMQAGTREAESSGPSRSTLIPPLPPVAATPVATAAPAPAARADSPSVASTAARVDTPPARAAAPVPTQSKPAPSKEARKTVAAKEQTPPPLAAKLQAGEAAPRQACAGKERYALLQCMETQCAKKALAKHDQCVRLRTERKL